MGRSNNDTTNQKAGVRYFRTHIAGLSVKVGEADYDKGQVAPEKVRFVQYLEINEKRGETNRVGYLETDNEVAIEKLLADSNVTEIAQDDYIAATDTSDPKVRRAAA